MPFSKKDDVVVRVLRAVYRHPFPNRRLNYMQPLDLVLTLRLNYSPKKSWNSGDRRCRFSISGFPLVAIKYNARIGFSFKYGGSPSNISIAMIPSDQMSTFGPYDFRVTTDDNELVFVCVLLSNTYLLAPSNMAYPPLSGVYYAHA